MELKIYYSENLETDVTTTLNIHNALELNKNQYSRSRKVWLSDIYGFKDEIRQPKDGIDYSTYMSSKNVGRGNFAEDYEITIELAKLITLNSRSIVKQRYAQWLLELERKLNNLEILTVEQAIFIQKLIELFRFISNQKQAVWDYLHTKNRPDVALKVAEMTYTIAKESGVKLFVTNETNLFQQEVNPVLKLK